MNGVSGEDGAMPPAIPQGRHAVVIGAGMAGLTIATALTAAFERVSGLLADLVAGGAPTGDTDRFRMCVNGHRLARGRTGRHSVTANRPFVEAHVRDRVRRDPAITLRRHSSPDAPEAATAGAG